MMTFVKSFATTVAAVVAGAWVAKRIGMQGAVRTLVVGFAVSAFAAAAGSILAAYLVNNVRVVRNAVGPL